MTETCTYTGDREEALIAYMYDDGDPVARRTFERHLDVCSVCRDEVATLGGVRQALAQWAPPEPHFVSRQLTSDRQQAAVDHAAATIDRQQPATWKRWNDVPAWAQVAAALLFLGVSAGIANLDVRYDQNGLVVRTGWMTAAPSSAAVLAPGAPSNAAQTVTREELVALERQLRSELRTVASARAAGDAGPLRVASPAPLDERRLRSLVEESEKRQQRELALRVAELVRDVNAQRQADLVRIDRNLGLMQNGFTTEALKQRESLNLLYRASLRQ